MASSLEQLETTHDIKLRWRSFELRPASAPPISEEYRRKVLAGRPRFNAIAHEHYGLNINAGPFGINSRAALTGAKVAESSGVGKAYHDAVFRAYWQDAIDISNIDELLKLATSIGLNKDTFALELESPEFESQVNADIYEASKFQIQGVPAMIFAQKYLVSGAQPVDMLRDVIDQIENELE